MFRFFPSGDNAFIIKAGNDISPEINDIIRRLTIRLNQEKKEFIIDVIPSYNELLIQYDPVKTPYREVLGYLKILCTDIENLPLPGAEIIYIPVVYGSEYGPDLKELSEFHKLSEEEIIHIHSSMDYRVYMLGFTPGFCYLGGMDERIATPRKKEPRTEIPAGSVGIANKQTGIYPVKSPGGWQLIGRTPVKLFNPEQEPAFLIEAGNYLRFFSITADEYQKISARVAEGVYEVKREKMDRNNA